MSILAKSVLIISNSDKTDDELSEALYTKGYLPHEINLDRFSELDLSTIPPKAIILKADINNDHVQTHLRDIKSLYAEFNIPILALIDTQNHTTPLSDAAMLCDSVLLAPHHPMQIVLRTMGLIRLTVMEQEINLRMQTLQEDFEFTPELITPNTDERFRILFIGKASPEFMIIINALQRENVNISAAFTSFTAFDYLYEQTFDAVVMNGLKGIEPAYSVTQTMRKNAKLYHVPALLLVDTETFDDHELIYEAGINDIIDAKSALDDIRGRILEQANFHQTHTALKNEFVALGDSTCIDELTQLYNRAFFNAHLPRVTRFYESQGLPISLCLIRVRTQEIDISRQQSDMIYKQLGSMIKNLVRLHDITARLDDNLFAIAFPGQSKEELRPVSERISSILKITSLSDQETGRPLKVELDITFSELDGKDTAGNKQSAALI